MLTSRLASLVLFLFLNGVVYIMVRAQCSVNMNDRSILVSLFRATEGYAWHNKSNWNTSAPLRLWHGVTVDATLAADHQVIEISLFNNQLKGSLPTTLGCLQNLKYMELYYNQITGTIPATISLLTNLQSLYIYGNSITGSLPSTAMATMTSLIFFGASNNMLAGNISFVGQMANLRYLHLASNQLTGSIATAIGDLAKLNFLDLSSNSLTGSIPITVQKLTNLATIKLHNNMLTGQIPTIVAMLTALQSLYLSGNSFSGQIPTTFVHLTSLAQLYLGRNRLFGQIPDGIWQLTSLSNLQLSDNQLNGTLTSSLGHLTQLKQLDISRNSFSGTIPLTVRNLKSLQFLGLSDNEFTGQIPNIIGDIGNKLAIADFSLNSLNGTFPSDASKLLGLTYLDLHGNLLSGKIGSVVVRLSNLQVLDISDNLFAEKLLDISSNSSLISFNAAYLPNSCYFGSYVRSIPSYNVTNTARCQDLQDLALCQLVNSATTIPEIGIMQSQNSADELVFQSSHDSSSGYSLDPSDTVYTLPALASTPLSKFTQFVIEFSNRTNLCSSLDFVKFCADANCEDVLWNSQDYLAVFQFNAKSFFGAAASIPIVLSSTSDIYLYYHNAYWDGGNAYCEETGYDGKGAYGFLLTITRSSPFIGWNCTKPTTSFDLSSATIATFGVQYSSSYASNRCDWSFLLCQNDDISSIDLTGLGIFGKLPDGLGHLDHLETLKFGGNGFIGTIPQSISQLSKLSILQLQYNALSGTLPVFLSRLTSLTSLQLNYNELGGTLPSEFGNLVNLKYVDLSRNSLRGQLPAAFSKLQNLDTLFLYNNELTGPLPASYAALSSTLKVLSLAENKLIGKLSYILCPLKRVVIDTTNNVELTCYESCWTGSVGVVRSNLKACAPSSQPSSQPTVVPSNQPTSYPSNPTSFPTASPKLRSSDSIPASISTTTVIIAIVAAVVGMCALSFLGYYVVVAMKRRKERLRIYGALEKLPVHKAIVERLDEASIIEAIRLFPTTVNEKDGNNQTSFDLAIEHDLSDNIIFAIVDVSLPIHPDTKAEIPANLHGYVWARIVQQGVRFSKVVERVLQAHANIVHELAYSTAEDGERKVLDVAYPVYKTMLHKFMCFLRRFEFETKLYKSSSSCVYSARDLKAQSGEDKVALKFCEVHEHYLREEKIRTLLGSGPDCRKNLVITLESINSNNDSELSSELARWHELRDYTSMMIMPLAEKNLKFAIMSEDIAAKDWVELRRLTIHLTEALQFLHSHGVIHGDFKASNVVRIENRCKLIDLDASAIIGEGFSGSKISSAYSPPELLFLDSNDEVGIRTFSVNSVTNEIEWDKSLYQLLPAQTSHDAWSLGCVLFQLYSGCSLFNADSGDNIVNRGELRELYDCNSTFLEGKTKDIVNLQARNLVSQLLIKDPSKRATMMQILDHPFVSGKKVARMIGQKPEFDVFISYRVSSDSEHAKMVYESLSKKGLKVWWDAKCLAKGVSWEDGFTDGLVKSRTFLPLLSREGLKNYESLQSSSRCDNVLLEWNLALELRERGLIEFIFPVLIGDVSEDLLEHCTVYSDFFRSGCSPNMSTSGPVVVDSVIKKLADHLNRLSLGSLLLPQLTVRDVMDRITVNQGSFIRGNQKSAFANLDTQVVELIMQQEQYASSPITNPKKKLNKSSLF